MSCNNLREASAYLFNHLHCLPRAVLMKAAGLPCTKIPHALLIRHLPTNFQREFDDERSEVRPVPVLSP